MPTWIEDNWYLAPKNIGDITSTYPTWPYTGSGVTYFWRDCSNYPPYEGISAGSSWEYDASGLLADIAAGTSRYRSTPPSIRFSNDYNDNWPGYPHDEEIHIGGSVIPLSNTYGWTIVETNLSFSDITDTIYARVDAPDDLVPILQMSVSSALPSGAYPHGSQIIAPTIIVYIEYLQINILTLPATNITSSSAILNGQNDGCSNVHFEYEIYNEEGDTIDEGVTSNQSVGDDSLFSANLILPSGWYDVDFRAVGTYGGETYYGDWEWFEHPVIANIETLDATQVGMHSAMLNGQYTGDEMIQLYFHLDTGEMLFARMGANTTYWYALYGLEPSTWYSFRAVGRLGNVYYYGDWEDFETASEPVIPPDIPPVGYTSDPSKFIFVPKRKLTV
jgi:hypothetical protein